jgi:hypothetical protein
VLNALTAPLFEVANPANITPLKPVVALKQDEEIASDTTGPDGEEAISSADKEEQNSAQIAPQDTTPVEDSTADLEAIKARSQCEDTLGLYRWATSDGKSTIAFFDGKLTETVGSDAQVRVCELVDVVQTSTGYTGTFVLDAVAYRFMLDAGATATTLTCAGFTHAQVYYVQPLSGISASANVAPNSIEGV